MTHTLQKNLTKALVAFVSVAVIVATFMVTVPKAHAVTIEGKGVFSTGNRGTIGAVEVSSTTAALLISKATADGGERNPDSAVNGYQVVREEVNMTIMSTTSTSTIGGGSVGDTHLVGLHISTALTGVCVIRGFGDTTGTTTSFIMPAGSVGYKEFKGAINSAGALTVTCPTAGDDNFVAVFWRPV